MLGPILERVRDHLTAPARLARLEQSHAELEARLLTLERPATTTRRRPGPATTPLDVFAASRP